MDVDLGDITLHIRDQGAGIPVVLLHGHWLPLGAPGKVNALLLDFLGQQGELSRSIR